MFKDFSWNFKQILLFMVEVTSLQYNEIFVTFLTSLWNKDVIKSNEFESTEGVIKILSFDFSNKA